MCKLANVPIVRASTRNTFTDLDHWHIYQIFLNQLNLIL